MSKAIFQAQEPYGLDRTYESGYYLIDVPVVDLNLPNKLEGYNSTKEVGYVTIEKNKNNPPVIQIHWLISRNVYNYTDMNDRTFYEYQDNNQEKIKQVAIEKVKSNPEYSFLLR